MAAFVTGVVGVGNSGFVGAESKCTKRADGARVVMSVKVASPKAFVRLANRFVVLQGKTVMERADDYMKDTIEKQYKAMTMTSGVYSTLCTEGSTKGAADMARVRVLGARFRMNQVSQVEKERMKFENRKQAITSAHGCEYEEKLFSKYPKSTAMYNLKKAEAALTCGRYAVPNTLEESYMAQSVDMQMKKRAVPYGEYTTKCSDGTTKDQAEAGRVAGMATLYRVAQLPTGLLEAGRYNSMMYALNQFGHGCSYEEKLFVKYPAIAGAMRGPAYGM